MDSLDRAHLTMASVSRSSYWNCLVVVVDSELAWHGHRIGLVGYSHCDDLVVRLDTPTSPSHPATAAIDPLSFLEILHGVNNRRYTY